MFNKYIANQQDIQAIEEGIAKVWHPKLNFIFENKKLIANVIVVSYDSKYAYVWSKVNFPKLTKIQCSLKKYYVYKIPHKINISDDYQYYWRASLQPREIAKFLLQKMGADELSTPFISGGLLVPFITIQKKKRFKNNPYITRESYLATIIHEFGHAYYNQHNLDGCLDKKEERLKLLKSALELYLHKTIAAQKPPAIYMPYPLNFSEIFAFCTDYTASNIFFTKHIQTINKFNTEWIKALIREEGRIGQIRVRDKTTISFIEGDRAHATAAVFGKIILYFYPENWPLKLLQYYYL